MAQEARNETRNGVLVGIGTGVLTIVLAAVSWGAGVTSRISALESKSADQQQRTERAERSEELGRQWMQEIRDRLARIEGRLERERGK